MVVFGAGASYDSSPERAPGNEDIRPPLAKELFATRRINAQAAANIPRCQLILDQLRNLRPDISVEQELERLRDSAKDYPEGKRQLVAVQFYLQWVISQTQYEWNVFIHWFTNYRTLLGQIDRQRQNEPVCLVTFNYDTFLEEAFSSLGKRFESLDDYISGEYKVIKLHGSVDWVRELAESSETRDADHVAIANGALNVADRIELSNKYHLTKLPSNFGGIVQWICSWMELPGSGRPGRQIVFPAIAIPFQNKTDFECPIEHQNVLGECISKTDKLLIIGWKGAEEKFVTLLENGLRKDIPIMVVSRDRESASRIFHKLIRGPITPKTSLLGETGFTEELRSGRIENFVAGRFHGA
jgi:hypothetical protein